MITFTAFSSFISSKFHFPYKLFVSHTNSHITLGPPVIKTKARETEGGAEDKVGGRCIPLATWVSALMVKNKQKNKQTNNQKQNETNTKNAT